METVWAAMIDVERVARCLPGATVGARNANGSYAGELVVKVGPTTANYAGRLDVVSVDETAHASTLDAAGTDRRGQGSAKATITFSLAAAGPDSTTVTVDSDYRITGRLARFGRGGTIDEIAHRLLGEFAIALQEMVGTGGVSAVTEVLAAQGAATVVEPAAPVPEPEPEPEPEPVASEPEPEPEPEPVASEPEPAGDTLVDVPAPVQPDPESGPITEEFALEPEQAPEIVSEAPAEPLAPVRTEPTGTAVPPSQATVSAAAPEPEPEPAPEPAPAPGPTPAPEPQPYDAGAVVRRSVADRVRQNPAPVVAAVVGLLVVRGIRRRRR